MTEKDFMPKHFTKVDDEAGHQLISESTSVPEVSISVPVRLVGPQHPSTQRDPFTESLQAAPKGIVNL